MPILGELVEQFITSTAYDGKPRRLYIHTCKQCKVNFYVPKCKERFFCSKKCSSDSKLVITTINCAYCFNKFERRVSKLRGSKSGLHFCNRKCKDKAQSLESSVLAKPDHYGNGSSNYRDIAFRHYQHNCNRCGYKEYPILRVHHKDRNRSNNELENLEILCPNCHEIEHYLKGDGVYRAAKQRGCGVIESM
jgi:HNH endonuclease